jgi:uncharacterized repeat protein (TIGR03803 family)
MYRKFYALSILFVLLFICVCSSQELIWMDANGLSYMKQDGSGLTQASDLAPHSVLGSNTTYYLDGGLYVCGINTEGGEENQKTGVVSPGMKGTIFQLDGQGLVQLHQFREGTDDPANTTLFITEDENIGYIGPYYTSTGNKQYQIGRAGSPGTRILQYAFNPNEILSSYEYYMNQPGAYGTSRTGGNYNMGFLFKVNSTGTGIEIKYHFKKETGGYPVGKLQRSNDENYLYGVTKTGGLYNYGVVFKVSPTGSDYQVMHHFNKADGAYPDRGLTPDYNGFLFGVTSKGGLYNKGVIFAIYFEDQGTSIVHHFTSEGAPEATYKVERSLLMNYDGSLIGKNNSSIYILSSSSSFRILRNIATKAITLRGSTYPDRQLKFPADGATNVAVNNTFKADTLDGALHYTLLLSVDEYFQSTALTVQSSTPSFQVQGLKPGTKYYARYKTSFWPDYGHYSSFTTAIFTTTGESVVTTPANGATNVEAPSLKVTVKAVTGATRYTVELSASSSFATVKSVTSAVDNQRTLTFSGLAYNTTYYARVKTNINSAYGAVTSFKTKAQVFSKVTSPASGAGGIEFNVLKIGVQALSQAKRYTLEVNTNASFTGTKIVYTSLGDGQTTFIIRDLAPLTTYYARVKADVNTTWGPTTSFTTRASKPLTRLWGITDGNDYAGGTIFSFSVDSLKFTEHYQAPVAEGFGVNMIAGPDGFYGDIHSNPYEVNYHRRLFRFDPSTGVLQQSAQLTNSEFAHTMMASNGQLYTALTAWTTAGKLVRVSADLTTFKEFYFYKNETGREPLARVIEVDGWLYGTTHIGGYTGWGVVYKMKPDGTGYKVLHDFNYNDGFFPRGLAYGNDGWIYGTTTDGPIDDANDKTGIVFRVRTDGSIYEVLHMFSDSGPHYPEGNIMIHNGVIFGVANSGGPHFAGAIFRMNTDGTGYVVMHQFNSTDGFSPNGDLTMGRDGFLYGTTMGGGLHNRGTLFRIRKDAAVFQNLFHFSDATGPTPRANVIVTDDTFEPVSAIASTSVARIDIYPNPTTETFRIIPTVETETALYVELADFNGTVFQKSTVNAEGLEVGGMLPKGIYILKVIQGDQVSTHRLVKK